MSENTKPNPSDFDNFNDYLQAVTEFNPTWVILDTVNDTIIMECETLNDALVNMYELTKYEKAHGIYQRGKNRIATNEENNTENETNSNEEDNEE